MWPFKNVNNFFSTIFHQNKNFSFLVLLLLDWLLVSFRISKSSSDDSDINIHFYAKERFYLHKGFGLFLVDIIHIHIYRNIFKKKNVHGHFLNKTKQINNNSFYSFSNKISLQSTIQLLFVGFKSAWKHLRFWVLPYTICILFIYYSFFLKSLPFSKVIFGYILLGNMFYLLFSGFVFFIKKYQYRLYTSVIQRFWRRTLIIFWAIEGSLFICFVYLIFNASQEPVHVYDNIQMYKTHFYSWRYFLVKIILSTFLIVFTYLLLLSLKWNTFTKSNNLVLGITLILLYVAWLEFYQLFHLMNCYGNAHWFYDFNEHLWNLELEFKRTRIVNHYVTIGLVAKFWHVVFAVTFWLFFVLRGVESSRYRYPLLVANLQNFLIIYIMSWLYMYPWFKYVARKFLDIPFFWFFVNNRKIGVFLLFNDIKLYTLGLIDYIFNLFPNLLNSFGGSSFFYWHESSSAIVSNTQFRKHNIRDVFIRNISI